MSYEHFGTSADMSGQLCLTDTSALVPKCLGSELSWVRSVLTPVALAPSLALWLMSGLALNKYRCEYDTLNQRITYNSVIFSLYHNIKTQKSIFMELVYYEQLCC